LPAIIDAHAGGLGLLGIPVAGVAPTDIDLLICATMTAEMPCPATAQQIAARIGAVPCGAFDLTSACTGYLTAMHLAANNIRAGVNRNILVVGTDLLSPTIDANDYKMAAIFGDAASAAVVSRSDNPAKGCFGQMMCADGREWAAVYQPRCPEDMPPGVDEPERYGILIMNGLAVYRFAVETMVQIIPEVLAGQGLTLADADLVLVHQSNLRIIERVRDALDLDANKCPSVIEWTGNTSGGSVGVVLDTVRRDGRLKPGMTVVLAAVGGGLSWGASVWKV
jgi:3-oxoacyl-[acyl-carrier-protein] synthase-3